MAQNRDFEADGFRFSINPDGKSVTLSGLINKNTQKVVMSIGNGAFEDCRGLTSVTIPDSVTSIGNRAFSYCSGLTNIKVASDNSRYDSRDNCNAIIETATNTLIRGCKSTVIPESVKTIGEDSFSGCSGLTSVTIPDSVTEIGGLAFRGCSGLTRIEIPDSVTTIGDDAFESTAWFDNQPDGLVYAGLVAYKYKGRMPSGTSIVIKDGAKGIADGAFWGCTGLTNVTIPDSVTAIGYMAFWGCTGLTSVTIPDSVTSICGFAFWGCTGLTSVSIPDSVTSIDYGAFQDCTGLTSVTIPDSVTKIGYHAFSGCSDLNQIILTGFGHNCKILPEEIQNRIEILRIGSGISEMGNLRCNPKEIWCYAEVPPRCSEGVFTGFDAVLHVPERAAAAYFEADVWRNFTNIVFDADEN